MLSLALGLVGLALALLATAGIAELLLHVGGSGAFTLAAALGLAAGMLVAGRSTPAIDAGGRRLALQRTLSLGLLALLAPLWLRPLAGALPFAVSRLEGRAALAAAFGAALLGLGPLAFAGARAAQALLALGAPDPATERLRAASTLLGAAAGFAAALAPPLAGARALAPEALAGAAALLAAACAATARAGAASPPRRPRGLDGDDALRACAAVALGIAVACGAGRLAGEGDPAAPHAIAIALAAGASALLATAWLAPAVRARCRGGFLFLAAALVALSGGEVGFENSLLAAGGLALAAAAPAAAAAVETGTLVVAALAGCAGAAAGVLAAGPPARDAASQIALVLLCVSALGWTWRAPGVRQSFRVAAIAAGLAGVAAAVQAGWSARAPIACPMFSPGNEAGRARAAALALALGEAPLAPLVIGGDAERELALLLAAGSAQVTHVAEVPRRPAGLAAANRYRAIDCPPRAFLEATQQRFDLVLDPGGALLRAPELAALVERVLAGGGVFAATLDLQPGGPLTPILEPIRALPRAALERARDAAVFVDHPRSHPAVLLALVAREPLLFPLARIARRLGEMGDAAAPLDAADLDLRGIAQCYVADRAALLAAPPTASLEQLLADPGQRFGVPDPLDPTLNVLLERVRRDRPAAAAARAAASATLGSGGVLDAGEPWLLESEVDPLFAALGLAPSLKFVRAPLERLRKARAAAGDRPALLELERRFAAAEPADLERQLALAESEERCGLPRAAIATCRRILAANPAHVAANLRLGFLLAGSGPDQRNAAAEPLAAALASDLVPTAVRAKAKLALAFASGRDAEARALLAELPAEAGDDALVRSISAVLDR